MNKTNKQTNEIENKDWWTHLNNLSTDRISKNKKCLGNKGL